MIDFRNVTVTYPDAEHPVLDEVNFTIAESDLCMVIGRTGTGKSTLLGAMNGLVPHFTGGELRGDVRVGGRSTATHRPRDLADLVGFVGQDPLTGFVTSIVEDEIAYGMEQLGLAPDVMRKRVEEALDLMNIASLRRRPLRALSGGQQQRVAIAAVLAAQPDILILDEPTSALDPTAAADVLSAIVNLVHDSGLTVVLAEHRIERVMKYADSILWVVGDGGAEVGSPGDILKRANVRPPLRELSDVLGWTQVPLSVRDARRRVRAEGLLLREAIPPTPTAGDVSVTARGVTVTYGPVLAVDKVDLDLHAGTVTALMGRNGSGKSSLLWALAGALDHQGEVTVADGGRLALVPQNAADLLYLPTVGQECEQSDIAAKVPAGTTRSLLEKIGSRPNPNRHPRDLSEGQRLALVLAIQLATKPDVVLLDEPTRGLDYAMKAALRTILRALAAEGRTVLVSTHDVEFVAMTADRTIIMADADIVADGTTQEVCVASPAFAPQVARVFSPQPALTVDDVRARLVVTA